MDAPQQQNVSVLRSTLSPDSVKAYIACLGSNRGLSIAIPAEALDEDAFLFTVDWNPNFRSRDDQLELKVINGKIDGATKVRARPPISVPFSITRDTGKTLFISATIDGQADIISLPRRASFTLKLREKYEPSLEKPPFQSIQDAGHSLDGYNARHCISASPNSILLPSTLIPQFAISGNRPKVVLDPDKKNSALNACAQITNSTPCKECTNAIRGRLSIWEAYVVELNDSKKATIEKVEGPRLKSFNAFSAQ